MCKNCQIDYIPIFICIFSIANLGLLIAELAYGSHWYDLIHPWWGYTTKTDASSVEKFLIVFITFSCVTIVGTLIFPRFFAFSSNARTRILIAKIGFIYVGSGVIVCVFGFLITKKTNNSGKCENIRKTIIDLAYNESGKWTIERYNKYLHYLRSHPNFYHKLCYQRSLKIEKILIAFTAILGIMAFLLVGVIIAYSTHHEEFVQP